MLRTRWAGVCLLLAALVFVASAAAGPWVHLRVVQQELAAGGAEGDSAPGQPQSHHEQGCALCHAPAEAPVAIGAGAALHFTIVLEPRAPERAASPATALRFHQRARAPPVLPFGSGASV